MANRIIFLAIFLITNSLFADNWYQNYGKALRAIKRQQWQVALDHLNAAIQERPQARANAKTYGLRFIDYLPYLYRGITRYHLNDVAGAVADFKKSDEMGEIRNARRNKNAVVHLETYQDLIAKKRQSESVVEDPTKRLFEEGVKAFENRDYEAARAKFNEVLNIHPKHDQAQNYLVKINAELTANVKKNQEETLTKSSPDIVSKPEQDLPEPPPTSSSSAEKISQKSSGGEKEVTNQMFEEGVEFFKNGDYRQAKLRFQKIKQSAASYERAAQYLEKITKVEESVKAGILAFFEGNNSSTIENLSQASLFYRSNPHILVLLGSAYATEYFLSGEENEELLELAKQQFAMAKKLDPGYRLETRYFSPRIVDLFTTTSQNN